MFKHILLLGIAAMGLAACAHNDPMPPIAAPEPGPVVLHDNPSLGVGVPNYPPPIHHHLTPHHQKSKAPVVVVSPPATHPPEATTPEHKQTWREKAKGWVHKKIHKDQ
jgi:hypothetical protein